MPRSPSSTESSAEPDPGLTFDLGDDPDATPAALQLDGTRRKPPSRDSAYASDESSPTLERRRRRCDRCILIGDCRRLPCGHRFCIVCYVASTPDCSLTVYCPNCGDQSVSPVDLWPPVVEERCDQQPMSSEVGQSSERRQSEAHEHRSLQSRHLIQNGSRHVVGRQPRSASTSERRQTSTNDHDGSNDQGNNDRDVNVNGDVDRDELTCWKRLAVQIDVWLDMVQRRDVDDHDHDAEADVAATSSTTSPTTTTTVYDGSELAAIIERLTDQFRRSIALDDRRSRLERELIDQDRRLRKILTRSDDNNAEQKRRRDVELKSVLRALAARARLERQRLDGQQRRSNLERRQQMQQTRSFDVSPTTDHHSPSSAGTNSGGGGGGGNQSRRPPNFRLWSVELSGDCLHGCRPNAKCTPTLTVRNDQNQLCKVDRRLLSAYLIRATTGKTAAVAVVREMPVVGVYQLIYYLGLEGSYHLIVKLAGNHVTGSPFAIRCRPGDGRRSDDYSAGRAGCSVHSSGPLSGSAPMSGSSGTGTGRASSGNRTGTTAVSGRRSAKSPARTVVLDDDLLTSVGSHGRGQGQFSNPQGVAWSMVSGRTAVADSNNQCVQVFDSQGDCVIRFGRRGRTAGELQRPTGVCWLSDADRLLVADYDNRWVSVHDAQGAYLGRFGANRFLGPRGLAVDADGHVIVVDNKASQVSLFDVRQFKFVRQFGSRGDRPEQLAGPHYCAVNPRTNLLYITDFHHHCVKVFDCRGGFQFAFGSLGEGNGQFQAPTGIAIDGNENVLVADWGNSRIQVFDSSGSFLSYVNSAAHPLFGPQGLAMTSNNHVVVADTGNHCYKIYRYLT